MRPLLTLLFLASILSAEPEETAWTPLFNGKDFEGWSFDVLDDSDPKSIWSVKDGTVLVSGKGKSTGVMRTSKDYADYELEFEWCWPDKPGNSGLLLHCGEPRERNVWPHSLEVQLANGDAGDFITIGKSIDVPKEQHAKFEPGQWMERLRHNLTDDSEKKPGEWNKIRVLAEGGNITVHINGHLVNKGTNCSARKGAICLQSEGANVQFRNIRLRAR